MAEEKRVRSTLFSEKKNIEDFAEEDELLDWIPFTNDEIDFHPRIGSPKAYVLGRFLNSA